MTKSKTKRFRQRANRYGFTINNPFITDDIKIIDPDNLTDEQKTYPRTTHDYSFIKLLDYEQFFDFATVEYDKKENGLVVGKLIGERAFFKDYVSAQEYFKTIDFIDYFCFQYEQGESGNKHLQGFMHFTRPMDFEVVRDIFPTMHLDKCEGKNYENRAYCMKEDTKIAGYDFFEHGALVEERQRTDMLSFKEDVLNKATVLELFDKYPGITLNSLNKITQLQQMLIKEEFKNKTRDLYVTYIYGAADAGKTTFVNRVLGYSPMEVGKITEYPSAITPAKFDDYDNQDIILFDEFYGQFPITAMNDLLNGQPRYLSARYYNRVACYTKVFITSNYSLEQQYRTERANGKEPSFEGFKRRINEIIYMPKRNMHIWEKGKPTKQVIKTLTEQGAKYEIKGE